MQLSVRQDDLRGLCGLSLPPSVWRPGAGQNSAITMGLKVLSSRHSLLLLGSPTVMRQWPDLRQEWEGEVRWRCIL